MTDSLTQAAGTVRGVLDDLSALPVTASWPEHTAAILDHLAAELSEAAALLRGVPGLLASQAEDRPGDR